MGLYDTAMEIIKYIKHAESEGGGSIRLESHIMRDLKIEQKTLDLIFQDWELGKFFFVATGRSEGGEAISMRGASVAPAGMRAHEEYVENKAAEKEKREQENEAIDRDKGKLRYQIYSFRVSIAAIILSIAAITISVIALVQQC